MSIFPFIPNSFESFFSLFFLFFLQDKTTFKNFFQVRFSTGLTDEGRRRTSAWRLANRGGREKLLSRKISLGTVFYKSYGITFLSRGGERWYQLNGKSFAFSEPARGLPRTGEKEENCSSQGCRCRLRSKIRDIRVLLFAKCSSLHSIIERDKQISYLRSSVNNSIRQVSSYRLSFFSKFQDFVSLPQYS